MVLTGYGSRTWLGWWMLARHPHPSTRLKNVPFISTYCHNVTPVAASAEARTSHSLPCTTPPGVKGTSYSYTHTHRHTNSDFVSPLAIHFSSPPNTCFQKLQHFNGKKHFFFKYQFKHRIFPPGSRNAQKKLCSRVGHIQLCTPRNGAMLGEIIKLGANASYNSSLKNCYCNPPVNPHFGL